MRACVSGNLQTPDAQSIVRYRVTAPVKLASQFGEAKCPEDDKGWPPGNRMLDPQAR